ELGGVIGAARLRSRSEAGSLPAAEWLPAHDGSGDRAVDVGVAHLDPVPPLVDLGGIERMDSTGQAEIGIVLDPDRVIEIVGTDHAEHRPETLRPAEPRVRRNPQLDAGRPEAGVASDHLRLEQPFLAGIERRERAPEGVARL